MYLSLSPSSSSSSCAMPNDNAIHGSSKIPATMINCVDILSCHHLKSPSIIFRCLFYHIYSFQSIQCSSVPLFSLHDQRRRLPLSYSYVKCSAVISFFQTIIVSHFGSSFVGQKRKNMSTIPFPKSLPCHSP